VLVAATARKPVRDDFLAMRFDQRHTNLGCAL
jgi:hypothetical protein